MDVRELVTTHYGAGDLSEAILEALASAGVDTEHLEPDDLFPVDQLHAGGIAAARYALERLEVGPGDAAARRRLRHRWPVPAGGDVRRPGDRRRPHPGVRGCRDRPHRAGRPERDGLVPGHARGGAALRRRLVRRRADGARRHEHPRQAGAVRRGPPGAGTRRTVRGLRPDADRRRGAPLPDAVGRGPAFVVRGDRRRVHRPPRRRRLHRDARSRTGPSRPWALHRTARCRRWRSSARRSVPASATTCPRPGPAGWAPCW